MEVMGMRLAERRKRIMEPTRAKKEEDVTTCIDKWIEESQVTNALGPTGNANG